MKESLLLQKTGSELTEAGFPRGALPTWLMPFERARPTNLSILMTFLTKQANEQRRQHNRRNGDARYSLQCNNHPDACSSLFSVLYIDNAIEQQGDG